MRACVHVHACLCVLVCVRVCVLLWVHVNFWALASLPLTLPTHTPHLHSKPLSVAWEAHTLRITAHHHLVGCSCWLDRSHALVSFTQKWLRTCKRRRSKAPLTHNCPLTPAVSECRGCQDASGLLVLVAWLVHSYMCLT